jgi:integrase
MKKQKEKKIFPKIRNCKNSLSSRWYIEYVTANNQNQIVRRKYYGDINKFNTVKARQKEAERIIKSYSETGIFPDKKGSKSIKPDLLPAASGSLISWLNYYIEDKKKYLRAYTLKNYENKVNSLIRWLQANNFENLKPENLNPSLAKAWLNSLSVSNHTYNHYITNLSGAYNFFIKMKLVKNNPFSEIGKLPKLITPAATFTRQQIEVLKKDIKFSDPQLWLFCQLMYYCFIRPGELRFLRVGDIDLSKQKILVRAEISKNKKSQNVAIPIQLFKELEQLRLHQYSDDFYLFSLNYKPGNCVLGYHNARNRFNIYLEKYNFSSKYKLYSWKHTGAAMCAMAGMPVKDLQLQLRHHSLDMVDRYLKGLGVMDMQRIVNNYPDI